MKLRVGRHNHRIIYRQEGSEPSDTDPMVGSTLAPEDAFLIVAAVNAYDPTPKLTGDAISEAP